MYCDKCHKHSPDNFKSCLHCGAEFAEPTKKVPERFTKVDSRKSTVSVKARVAIALAVAVVIAVAATVTASVTSSKPEAVVKKMVEALREKDGKKYFSIFDESFVEYKTDSLYYDGERAFSGLTEAMRESDEFYKSQCGEGYTVSYNVTSVEYLDDADVEAYGKYLSEYCGYQTMPSQVARLGFKVVAKGELGEYESVYESFYCHKIGSRWYRAEYNFENADSEKSTN